MGDFLELLRVKHWVKNIFVLAPSIFSENLFRVDLILPVLTTVLFFCLASSAVYIFNDLCDRGRDRLHSIKSKTRPLAAGRVTVRSASSMVTGLLLLLGICVFWRLDIALIIGVYLLINVSYSMWLKDIPVVELFLVASGFPLRIYAGAVTIGVPITAWMFVTVLALALFLVCTKRLRELRDEGVSGSRPVLRAYTAETLSQYVQISSFSALNIYCMYVIMQRADLFMTVPLVMFGFFRYFLIVTKSERGGDPTDVLWMDWLLLGTIGLCGLIIILVVGGVM